MLKLAIGVPAYGGSVSSAHVKMWLQVGAAIARGKDRGVIEPVMFADIDVAGVERARNILLKTARELKADWLVTVDADTWVANGADLVRMIIEAPKDAAIIGAPVRVREGNHENVSGVNIYRHNPENNRYYIATELTLLDLKETVFRVDAIGAAVMAMQLSRIGESTFRFEDGISEDLCFCAQVRALGGAIYADARVQTFHLARPKVLTCASAEPIDRAAKR